MFKGLKNAAVPEVKPKVGGKEKFEERLRLLGEEMKLPGETISRIKGTWNIEGQYKMYEFLCDYIVIRCYEKHFTIHTNGDITHYECKRCLYNDVTYEVPNLVFIARLLHQNDTKN